MGHGPASLESRFFSTWRLDTNPFTGSPIGRNLNSLSPRWVRRVDISTIAAWLHLRAVKDSRKEGNFAQRDTWGAEKSLVERLHYGAPSRMVTSLVSVPASLI